MWLLDHWNMLYIMLFNYKNLHFNKHNFVIFEVNVEKKTYSYLLCNELSSKNKVKQNTSKFFWFEQKKKAVLIILPVYTMYTGWVKSMRTPSYLVYKGNLKGDVIEEP